MTVVSVCALGAFLRVDELHTSFGLVSSKVKTILISSELKEVMVSFFWVVVLCFVFER